MSQARATFVLAADRTIAAARAMLNAVVRVLFMVVSILTSSTREPRCQGTARPAWSSRDNQQEGDRQRCTSTGRARRRGTPASAWEQTYKRPRRPGGRQ